ncbi:histidine kinase [Streptomyces turgidiscabies]|uniref:histidine kinase n=2 Tax=Streptomyces TaxID=1883 RepID=L7FBV9_STRT8|nr:MULTISPECIES: histidine kinase [Streptomyces]ELP68752.1 histidine kinase [Streptomyces turgidiscabies Car8]MDX3492510.1 histidine kinase [Streptomyces turgidiscabies]GAQ69196.1 sensor histidine kinase DesK [Streptomyces turgidiscabies]
MHTNPEQKSADGGGLSRSPEFRLAMDALAGLRADLFEGAFAYRPLAPRNKPTRIARVLPRRLRPYAVWAPHALVGAAGLLAMFVSFADNGGNSGTALAMTLFSLGPILLTLVRPAGAFWFSLVSIPIVAALGPSYSGDWPFMPASFVAHLVVMTVVAARTRPRTAAWMWVLTVAYGMAADASHDALFDGYYFTSNVVPFLFLSALSLLVVTVLLVRRAAEQEVTAQQTVTAHERSKRTLLEERTTIARELHDVVAHHMSVVAIQAEAAPYRVENPPEELTRAFATIRENAVAALTELRRVLGVVRAEDYEAPDAPQPTLAELDALLTNVREAGLAVDKTVTGAVRELPQGVELSAYRIVQEALSNTLRHAPGASARVEIGYVLGGLGLRIVNGPAAEVSFVKQTPTEGAGHGLTGMRERVAMLNGALTTVPTPDGGYEVTVFLPVVPVANTTDEDGEGA